MIDYEEKFLRQILSGVEFEDLKGKEFDLILVVERLCEVCEKPLDARERFLKRTRFLSIRDYNNLLDRTRIYDRIEVDVEVGKIYLYSHDFPGDVHPECIEKL